MDIIAFFKKDENGNHLGKSEYQNIVNGGLGGQFQAKFTENDNGSFTVSLEATEGGGDLSKLSDEQRSFYDNFSTVANDHNSFVVQDFVLNDEHVQGDSYKSNKADIGDMSKSNSIGDKNHTGGTSQGHLIHNLVEQYQFTKIPGSERMSPDEKMNTYSSTHAAGMAAENAVNGNTRLEEQEYRQGNTYYKFYRENNGATTTEKISIFNSNMTIDKTTIRK